MTAGTVVNAITSTLSDPSSLTNVVGFAIADGAGDLLTIRALKLDLTAGSGWKDTVVNVGSDIGGIVNDTATLIGLLPVSQSVALVAAVAILGVAGATIALGMDSVVLVRRTAFLHELNKESHELDSNVEKLKEKGIHDAESSSKLQRDVLAARTKHAKAMVASSTAAVASDGFTLAGSLVPVVGMPSNVVGLFVAAGRIYGERRAGLTLKSELEHLSHSYRKSNRDKVEDPAGFRHEHHSLKDSVKDASKKKEAAEKTLESEIERSRKLGMPKDNQPLKKAQDSFAKAVTELQAAEAELLDFEVESGNYEAYLKAQDLLRELDPKLHEEQQIKDLSALVELFRAKYPEVVASPEAIKDLKKDLKKQEKELEKGAGKEKGIAKLQLALEVAKDNLKKHPASGDATLHAAALSRVKTITKQLVELTKKLETVRSARDGIKLFEKNTKELEKLQKAKEKRDHAPLKAKQFETPASLKSPRSEKDVQSKTNVYVVPPSREQFFSLHTAQNFISTGSPGITIFHSNPLSPESQSTHVSPTSPQSETSVREPATLPPGARTIVLIPREEPTSPSSSHEEAHLPLQQRLPLDMVRVADPLSLEEAEKDKRGVGILDDEILFPTPSPTDSSPPVSKSETDSRSFVTLKSEESESPVSSGSEKSQSPVSSGSEESQSPVSSTKSESPVSSEPQSAKSEPTPSSTQTITTEDTESSPQSKSVVDKTTVSSRAKQRKKVKQNNLHGNTEAARRINKKKTVSVKTT